MFTLGVCKRRFLGFETFLKRLLRAEALRRIQKKNIHVHIFSGKAISRLNRRIFKRNRSTDVIALDYRLKRHLRGLLDGEVFVSLDAARRQAPLWGHTFRQEIAFLIAHGLLHLCGFSDKTRRDRLRMWRIQERLIRKL